MGHQDLIEELRAAGYDPAATTADGNVEFVCFDYPVRVGAYAGEIVRIGLNATDWPFNPPGGVHVAPRIQHPGDNAHHASPLGPNWIYWSRPFPDWASSQRSLAEYLAHLRTLFSQFVEPAA